MSGNGTSNVTLTVNDKPAAAYLALPPSGKGAGVLVLHAWWGLTPFFTGLCDRLAAAGLVAMAPDMNDGKVATTIPEAEAINAQLDNQRAGDVAFNAIKHLRAHPALSHAGLGVVGFSMGAWWAVQSSIFAPDDIKAVVLFYGIGMADFSKARTPFLGHFAEHDVYEPSEGVRQMEADMRAAGRTVTLHTYPGTSHWFFEQNRPDAYNADAAQLAWDRTLAFLRTQLV